VLKSREKLRFCHERKFRGDPDILVPGACLENESLKGVRKFKSEEPCDGQRTTSGRSEIANQRCTDSALGNVHQKPREEIGVRIGLHGSPATSSQRRGMNDAGGGRYPIALSASRYFLCQSAKLSSRLDAAGRTARERTGLLLAMAFMSDIMADIGGSVKFRFGGGRA
jgi:hypothetical protein